MNAMPLFAPGRIVTTVGAQQLLLNNSVSPLDLLSRHLTGDWGDVDAEDRALNDASVTNGTRILSAYVLSDGEVVWLITEADRSVTTFLLPEEY